jgi:hypothetical protein
LKTVLARIFALLLAVLMMAGAAAQACASPDVASECEIDDAPAVDTPVLPVAVAVPRPDLREPICIEAPRSLGRGRLLAVLVFRPPRLVAAR